jgi:hypothetical protein
VILAGYAHLCYTKGIENANGRMVLQAPAPALTTGKVSFPMATNDSTPRTIEIPLTKGYVTVVDEIDADLAALKWYPVIKQDRVYVWGKTGTPEKGQTETIYLHRIIFERVIGRKLLPTEIVDHVDNNPLQNNRLNLRLADKSTNAQNSKVRVDNSTGYKGVSGQGNYFNAEIKSNGAKIFLGSFRTAEEAGAIYNLAACNGFGDFARINDIPDWQTIAAKAAENKLSLRNKSGYTGVSAFGNKWKAQITVNKKAIHLGLFNTPEEAHESFVNAQLKFRGLK